jgi:hypothetical protein
LPTSDSSQGCPTETDFRQTFVVAQYNPLSHGFLASQASASFDGSRQTPGHEAKLQNAEPLHSAPKTQAPPLSTFPANGSPQPSTNSVDRNAPTQGEELTASTQVFARKALYANEFRSTAF